MDGKRQHDTGHQQVSAEHPATMVTKVINCRGPQEFQGPGQPQQTQKTDFTQVHSLLAEVHRKNVVENTQRKTFGKVQDAYPEHF